MKVYAYSLSGTLFEGEADVLTVPSSLGELSILDNHVPIVAELKKGNVRLKKDNAVVKELSIGEGGSMEVSNNKAILLLN